MNIALELMMLGMGTVFVFLVALMFATKLMSALVIYNQVDDALRAGTNSPEQGSQTMQHQQSSKQGSPAKDARLLHVINEAIKQHRTS